MSMRFVLYETVEVYNSPAAAQRRREDLHANQSKDQPIRAERGFTVGLKIYLEVHELKIYEKTVSTVCS